MATNEWLRFFPLKRATVRASYIGSFTVLCSLLAEEALLLVVKAETVRGRQDEQVVDDGAAALATVLADLNIRMLKMGINM